MLLAVYPSFFDPMPRFIRVLQQPPSAIAEIRGSSEFPSIRGNVLFHQTASGVLVSAQIAGLPLPQNTCGKHFFAFHIHDGTACSGNTADPFANAGSHYNPEGCPHPEHAGDLIPLLGSNGYAFEIFLTDRFLVNEIVGKTVILHLNPDDFTSQPSGNAGQKIACGRIR